MKKILILRNDRIGDMVVSTQLFRAIKKNIPQSEITVIDSPLNRPLIEKNPFIDKIIDFELPKKNIISIIKFIQMGIRLRKERYDYGIDLRGSIANSIFLLWLAGIKNSSAKSDVHQIPKFFVAKPINSTKNHILEKNTEVINRSLNLHLKSSWPEIIINKEDIEDVKKFIIEKSIKRFICLFPIAGTKNRQLNLEKFEEIISYLQDNYPGKILIFGTKQEKELLNRISRGFSKAEIILDYNIRKLSLILKKSELVIAQDGGPMHIAWASKAKLIALYPKWIDWFEPLGKNTEIIYSYEKGLTDISANTIIEKIKRIIKI